MPRNGSRVCAGGGIILAFVQLAGCVPSPLTGNQIVQDLERSGVPRPNASGGGHESPAPAALPVEGPVSLADLLRIAEDRSPALAAAKSEVGVAAGERWQASMYPNPLVDVLSEDISLRDGADGAKTTVGITQPIVLGNRRQAAMDAASAAELARIADVEVQRRALFGEIAAEYSHIIAVNEQTALYGQLRELAQRTVTVAGSRFEAKAAPETDVIRPRVELRRIEAAIGRLSQERTAATRRLSLLLGGVEIDTDRLVGTMPLDPQATDLEQLNAVVKSSHPALVAADHEIDAAGARIEQVRAERTPDLDVRVGAGYRGSEDDGIVEVGLGMKLPLWDKREGAELSARFRLMEARQRRDVLLNDLLAQLTTAVSEYEAARAQLTSFRDQIVPDAQRAFDQTGEGYRAGRSSFLDMLDAQRTLAEARIEVVDLAASALAARARILQLVGPEGIALDPGALPVGQSNVVPNTERTPREGPEKTP